MDGSCYEQKNADDSYVNISDIAKNYSTEDNDYDDEDEEQSFINVMQIQCLDNDNKIKVVHVGNLLASYDIIIKNFDISDHVNCILMSCLYDSDELTEIYTDNKIYPIVRLILNKKTDDKIIPLCSLDYNTHFSEDPFVNVSDKEKNILLEAKFSVTLNYTVNDKHMYRYMEENSTHTTMTDIFDKLIQYTNNDYVSGFILKT